MRLWRREGGKGRGSRGWVLWCLCALGCGCFLLGVGDGVEIWLANVLFIMV